MKIKAQHIILPILIIAGFFAIYKDVDFSELNIYHMIGLAVGFGILMALMGNKKNKN